MSKEFSEEVTYPTASTDDRMIMPVATGLHRVLHIDCDEDAALVLATLLVPDVHVTHAQSMGEAAALIAQESFSLVVLDPDLPDGDGLELLESLSVILPEAPVLLYSQRQVRHGGMAHAFLPKPWTSPRQLYRSLTELLMLSSATSNGSLC
jgi:CheY-like chemotaxis protein